MQIRSAPSTQNLLVLGTLLAAIVVAASVSARVAPILSPLVPAPSAAPAVPGQPVGNGTGQADPVTPADPGAVPPSGAGQAEPPGRMFDDMPIDPPVHEPGTGTPRYAGE